MPYNIYFRKGSDAFAKWSGSPVAGPPATITGLTNGTRYDFYVTALSAEGVESDPSAIVSATPIAANMPPPAPVLSSVTLSGQNQVLAWQAVTASDLMGYNCYRRLSPGDAWSQFTSTSALTATDTAASGQAYFYMVRAYDTGGVESADSNAIQGQSASDPRPAFVDVVAFYEMDEVADGGSVVARLNSRPYGMKLTPSHASVVNANTSRGRAASVAAGRWMEVPLQGGPSASVNDYCVCGFLRKGATTSNAILVGQTTNGLWTIEINGDKIIGKWRKSDDTWAQVTADAYFSARGACDDSREIFVAFSRTKAGELRLAVMDANSQTTYVNTGSCPNPKQWGLVMGGTRFATTFDSECIFDHWMFMRSVPSVSDLEWYCNGMAGRSFSEMLFQDEFEGSAPFNVKLIEEYLYSDSQIDAQYKTDYPDWPLPGTTSTDVAYPVKPPNWAAGRGYWLRPYRLRDMGAQGATIASAEGAEYWWPESGDHMSTGSIIMGGFSNDPAIAPSAFYHVWDNNKQGYWDPATGTTKIQTFVHTETPWLVYNPDDAEGKPFYLFYHGSSTSNSIEQWTFLITSSDLRNWTSKGIMMRTTNGPRAYCWVYRRGAGDWVASTTMRDGAPGEVFFTSSATSPVLESNWVQAEELPDIQGLLPPGYQADGFQRGTWFQDPATSKWWAVGRCVDWATEAPIVGYKGILMFEVRTPLQDMRQWSGGMQDVIVPGTCTWIDKRHATPVTGDPDQLQHVAGYNDTQRGIAFLYAKWGFRAPAAVSCYAIPYDMLKARLAVPVGVRAFVAPTGIKARVADALPHRDYTFQIATNAAFSAGVFTDNVTGLSQTWANVTPGTTYYIRARARYGGMDGAWSPAIAITYNPPTAPVVQAFPGTKSFEVRTQTSQPAVCEVEYMMSSFADTEEAWAQNGVKIAATTGYQTDQCVIVPWTITSISPRFRVRVHYKEGEPGQPVVTASSTVSLWNGVVYPLTLASTVEAAYSCSRQIGASQTAAYIAIDASNNEYTIGFNGAGEIDQAALLSHGSDLWVKTFLDATGAGNHMTPAADKRPKVVEAGQVVKSGAVPVAKYTSMNQQLPGGTSYAARTIMLAYSIYAEQFDWRWMIRPTSGYVEGLTTPSKVTDRPRFDGADFGVAQSGMHVYSMRYQSYSAAEARMDATVPVTRDPVDTGYTTTIQMGAGQMERVYLSEIVVIRGSSAAEESAMRQALMDHNL